MAASALKSAGFLLSNPATRLQIDLRIWLAASLEICGLAGQFDTYNLDITETLNETFRNCMFSSIFGHRQRIASDGGLQAEKVLCR
jgi:hypothetical protein